MVATRPQFSTLSSVMFASAAPFGATKVNVPPLASNVAATVSRRIVESTGIVMSRSAAMAEAQITSAASPDVSRITCADRGSSSGLRKNGCPPVSLAMCR